MAGCLQIALSIQWQRIRKLADDYSYLKVPFAVFLLITLAVKNSHVNIANDVSRIKQENPHC